MKKDKKETKLSSEQPGKKDILDQSATQEDKELLFFLVIRRTN